ncbi:prepilin peptidase [Vibrio sp. JC009]|uniref:prepilin peptidase n=1 Tax=Vibrio sp. JC009 TaxID=2912314 RepID=UPI0023AF24B4|nr:prepilin peptidase [Vibrio sp. JC009]WED24563.1 prepilin peptidase [Vibrio sp. JC009]
MLTTYLSILIIFAITILTLRVCFNDIRNRTISNKQVIAVLIGSLVLAVSGGDFIHTMPYALSILVVGVVLFLIGVWGAGDAKLLFAYSVAIKPEVYPAVLLIGAVFAIIQIIATVIYHGGLKNANKAGVAFGVPIGAAGLSGIMLSFLMG